MRVISNRNNEYEEILTHTVSDTWNGKTINHGSVLSSMATYDGSESISVSAGNFSL